MTPKFYFSKTTENSDALIPTQANATDTGYDVALFSPTHTVDSLNKYLISPKSFQLLPLGIKVICPDGWWLQLDPRSSTFFKKHLITLVGVIDNGYENEIKLAVYNPSSEAVQLVHNDRIGQLIPMRLEKMDVVEVNAEDFAILSAARKSSRGTGGFGSSGN